MIPTEDADAETSQPHGPAVADSETLLRAIVPRAAAVWLPGGVPSSAIFSHPKFSADIERLTTLAAVVDRWDGGNGVVAFSAGAARELGFRAHHEPEHGNDAHANVYSDAPPAERKRQARKLAASATCRAKARPIS